MEAKTKVINVPVSPETHRAAKILCIQRGLTQAQLIDRLIRQAAAEVK
jgi:hypothetical protein